MAGLATALVVRALADPSKRGAPPAAQIRRYGFKGRTKDRANADVGGIEDQRAGVGVDRDNRAGSAHTDRMIELAARADAHEKPRRDIGKHPVASAHSTAVA